MINRYNETECYLIKDGGALVRNIIDSKRLKEERPDLAAEYTKESSGMTPHYA